MSNPSFNLVDQPWIPCITLDGKKISVLSLNEALTRAHELRAIHADPPTTAALMRLMIAVVHRVLNGPKDIGDWDEAWQKEKFDGEAVREYLGTWRQRFDLFHPTEPFFQVRFQGEIKEKPPSLLNLAAATENNPTLFDHSTDASSVPMPAAEAAQWLITIQAFGSCGLVGGEGGGRTSGKAGLLAGSWVFFVTGKSLFHTLLLNTPIYDPSSGQPFQCSNRDEDMPVWERGSSIATAKRDPAGWLDLLTYPSRRIELIPSSPYNANNPLVVGVKRAEGNRPNDKWTLHGREMSMAFVKNKKYGFVPLRPDENRDLWRDATVLISTKAAGAPEAKGAPKILEYVAKLVVEGKIDQDERLGLDAYAIATNRASYLYWRHERLPLRTALFQSEKTADVDEGVAEAINRAHQVADCLQYAVAVLTGHSYDDANLGPDERKRRKLWAQQAMGEFWAPLGPSFDQFLNILPDDRQEALRGWYECLAEAIDAVWSSWTAAFPSTPAALRRAAQAERYKKMASGKIPCIQEEAK